MKAATTLALALALGACSSGRPTLVDPDGTLRFAAHDEVEPTVDGSGPVHGDLRHHGR